MSLEEEAGGVGGQAEHGADREVDVARDDHHRLADREQPMIDAPPTICWRFVALTKFGLLTAVTSDDERERQHDPELAEAEARARRASASSRLWLRGGGMRGASSVTVTRPPPR